MSIYSELLKMALAEASRGDDDPASLLAEVVACRERVRGDDAGGTAPAGTPERLGDLVAYDVALIRACRFLGIPHALADGGPTADERARVEASLAQVWQNLAGSDG